MTHDQRRFWGHFPLGLLNGLLYVFPPAGLGLTGAFLAYEYIQEWRKEDWSFKDVIGWLVGLTIGLTLVTAAFVVVVIWWLATLE